MKYECNRCIIKHYTFYKRKNASIVELRREERITKGVHYFKSIDQKTFFVG